MTGTTIASYGLAVTLAVIAAIEAVVIVVQAKRLSRRTEDLAEAQRRLDTRANLLSGGREAVKQVWQTATIMRKEGFGAAVRSSIEDLADWAEVSRSSSPTSRARPHSTNASVTAPGSG